jgi:hypothetical protein
MKKVLPLILVITVLLTACGAKATPTIDAASVQASAVAMAFTMSAQTQVAMPTATLVPPSPTATFAPPPSPTAFALPTFPVVLPTATSGSSSANPCSVPLAKNPTGRTTTLRIVNENKAGVNGSICLSKTPFGEFGVIGVSLSRNQDTILTVPQGCYSAYFWVNDPKKPSTAQGYGLCMNNTDKWTMVIRQDNVVLKGP